MTSNSSNQAALTRITVQDCKGFQFSASGDDYNSAVAQISELIAVLKAKGLCQSEDIRRVTIQTPDGERWAYSIRRTVH